MKKRILSLLMTMVMVFGIGVVSHATEDDQGVLQRHWSGTYVLKDGEHAHGNVESNGDYIDVIFKDITIVIPEAGPVSLRCSYERDGELSSFDISFQVTYDEYDLYYWSSTYPSEYVGRFSMMADPSVGFLVNINGERIYMSGASLELIEEPTEPVIHEISTPFTGTAVSDREEYTLALAGYFEKELTDGTHELTLEEINAQTISIVAYNKANGVKRVMTQSTIEEMSVTVANGEIVQYTIRGRVQTNGGKLDRYTAVIDQ